MSHHSNLFVRIACAPPTSAAVRAGIAADVKPPSNYSKADTIAAWEKDKKPTAVEAALNGGSMDDRFGKVMAIAWAVGNETPHSFLSIQYPAAFGPDGKVTEKAYNEHDPLEQFFAFCKSEKCGFGTKVVCHTPFALRFLHQRAIVNGVQEPAWWPWDARPWDADRIFDTEFHWTGDVREHVEFEDLTKLFHMEPQPKVTGSDILKAFDEMRQDYVLDHLEHGVERLRFIHDCMWFEKPKQPEFLRRWSAEGRHLKKTMEPA